MEDLPVGSEITLKVVEINKKSCSGCFFDGADDYCGATSLGLKLECFLQCRSGGKNVIYKKVKVQKRKMKEDKYSLKISRNYCDTTLDGYPIATYSNDELKILKRLLTKVLGEVNEYIHL